MLHKFKMNMNKLFYNYSKNKKERKSISYGSIYMLMYKKHKMCWHIASYNLLELYSNC